MKNNTLLLRYGKILRRKSNRSPLLISDLLRLALIILATVFLSLIFLWDSGPFDNIVSWFISNRADAIRMFALGIPLVFVLEKEMSNLLRKANSSEENLDFHVFKRSEKDGISMAAARVLISEEEEIKLKQKKELELLGGFLKVLDYLRETGNFYRNLISLFLTFSLICVFAIIWISQYSGAYHEITFENKSMGRIMVEGFLTNVRFFVYESLVITLLGYFLKKISNYISMLEIYKELEIMLIMDVQRQEKSQSESEKGIVSSGFQDMLSNMLSKHYDSFMKSKSELKLRTAYEMIGSLQDKRKV